jgi:hypothetical protein
VNPDHKEQTVTRQNIERPPRYCKHHAGLIAAACVLGTWLLLATNIKAETEAPGRAGEVEVPATVTLTPGHPLRIKIQVPATEKGGGETPPGGRTIILRVEIEGGTTGSGGGGDNPPPPPSPPVDDALTTELRTLYQKDADPDKARHAAALAGLYQWGATNVGGSSYSDAGSFRKALGEESTRRLPTDVLLPLRQRMQVELRKVLPAKSSDPLTPDVRSKASALFTRLAAAMDTAARAPARGTTRRKAGQPTSPEAGR